MIEMICIIYLIGVATALLAIEVLTRTIYKTKKQPPFINKMRTAFLWSWLAVIAVICVIIQFLKNDFRYKKHYTKEENDK